MDAAAVEAAGNFAKGSGKNLPTSGYLGTTYYGPMGGAWSSAADMAMFAEALLKGGSGKLLDAASHAEWSKARAQTDGGPKDSWGLGVNISERDNGDIVWTHTGSVDGYRAELFMTPKTKFAVVILVSENFAPYQYAGEMHELFTGKKVGQPVFAPFSSADVPGQLGKYDSTTMGELVVSQGAGAALMLKDLKLALAAATNAGASVPMGAQAAALYQLFANNGGGGQDFSAIVKLLRG